jgi:hypothetical protein
MRRRSDDDEGGVLTGLDDWRLEHQDEYDWWDDPEPEDDDDLQVHDKRRYSDEGGDDG